MNGTGIKETEKIKLFGLDFFGGRIDAAVADIVSTAKKKTRKLVITPNVDHIILIKKDPHLLNIWKASDFLFADGMPIIWASKLVCGKSLPERITGADLMPLVCEAAADAGLVIMLVGGAPGVAEAAKVQLLKKNPKLNIPGILCPDIGFEKSIKKTVELIEEINHVSPHILFFCTGCPKSEKWLFENGEKLNFGVALCVGAAIDFEAGSISRAPVFFRSIGFEWFWRLCNEPRRLWKRYLLDDPIFIYYAVNEIIFSWIRRGKGNEKK